MQHVPGFGYPTPPASPVAFELASAQCSIPQAPLQHHQQHPLPTDSFTTRHVPLAPEERLGRILEGRLRLSKILGTGAYGVVYSAIDVKTGVKYAVKCLNKFNADGSPLDRRQVAFQRREIQLHYQASDHPNVVSLLRIVEHADCIYVILEYCPEGDLFYNITERNEYVGRDDLSKRVFLQILDAVEHCHSRGIFHRDLKPENILVSNNGETVKLADFGLATSSERSEDYGCGSTFYMSPECLDPSARRPYYLSAPNDVWSLGVILVNLTCGRNPWKQASIEDSTYRAYIRCADFLKTILPITDELNAILGRIFESNPDQRITLHELRQRILACQHFTVNPNTSSLVTLPSPPASVESIPTFEYVDEYEHAIIDDEDEDLDDMEDGYESPLSPASTCSVDSCGSDDESLASSVETLDDLDDFPEDEPATPEGSKMEFEPHIASADMGFIGQEYVAQHCAGSAPPVAPAPLPSQEDQPMIQHPVVVSVPTPQVQPPPTTLYSSIPAAPSAPPHASQPAKAAMHFMQLVDLLRCAQMQGPSLAQPSQPFYHQIPPCFAAPLQGY